jgi:predicted nucleotidyltransferase
MLQWRAADQRRNLARGPEPAHLDRRLGNDLVDLRLFGSVARGDDAPDSDIDVFVVVQPDEQRVSLENQIIDLAFDINLEHSVYISPHVVTPTILEHPVWRETPFLKTVAREAVPL